MIQISRLLALTVLAVAIPAASFAQPPAPASDVNRSAPISIEGTITQLEWGGSSSLVSVTASKVTPASMPVGPWIVRGPGVLDMLRAGLSVEVLKPGTAIAVAGYRLIDTTCNPDCTLAGSTITLGNPAKAYEIGPK